jgi:beta-ribofuranosylaminobenzene 5'-phosphate synthase
MVHVRAFPRIHISLIDLGNATGRHYGGGGFNIDGNCTEVSAVMTQADEIEGLDLVDDDARSDVDRVLSEFRSFRANLPRIRISIRRVPSQHAGFGTKTALLLAILSAANLETAAGLTQVELQRLSGRGGTSGVGINLFFEGGFVCDLGHPNRQDMSFQPSSYSYATEIPPIACRWNFPEIWRVLLVLPPGKRLAGASEGNFFRASTPLPSNQVLEALAAMYHGVLPAVITSHHELLSFALGKLHKTGFKRLELEAQSEEVKRAYRQLSVIKGIAIGLSSLGPLLYAVVHADDSQAIGSVEDWCLENDSIFLGAFRGRNLGCDVIHD